MNKLALLAVMAVAACGTPSARRIGPGGKTVVKLDPVNPTAARAFEAAK